MSDTGEVNEWYTKAVLESGKDRDEIARLVLKKQEKFSGLLTESGALFLVAKELGVQLSMQTHQDALARDTAKILEIKNNDFVKKMVVEVVSVYPKRRFDKNGKKGQVQNVLVKDETGSTMWTLWNHLVDEAEKQELMRGARVELREVRVRSRDDRVNVQLEEGGTFCVLEKPILLPLSLSEVKETSQEVLVEARLVRKFPPKSFEKNDRKGQLERFILDDGNTQMDGVAWNDAVLQLELIPIGSLIRVENAYAKKNLSGNVELQIGWQGRLQVLEAARTESQQEMTIGGLVPEKMGRIRGVLAELDCLKSHYDACQKCGKKVEKREDLYWCAKCEHTTAQARAMAKFVLKDETGEIHVVAFGEEAEKVWGKSGKELREMGIEDLEQLANSKNDGIVSVEGMVRENAYTRRLEMSAQRVA